MQLRTDFNKPALEPAREHITGKVFNSGITECCNRDLFCTGSKIILQGNTWYAEKEYPVFTDTLSNRKRRKRYSS